MTIKQILKDFNTTNKMLKLANKDTLKLGLTIEGEYHTIKKDIDLFEILSDYTQEFCDTFAKTDFDLINPTKMIVNYDYFTSNVEILLEIY